MAKKPKIGQLTTTRPRFEDIEDDQIEFEGTRFYELPQAAAPETTVEPRGTMRAIGDTAVQFGKGAVTGVRMMSDVFGADNAVSGGLRSADEALNGLLSATAKQDQAQVAAIMQEAEGKGWMDQIGIGLRAAGVAPGALLAQAAGTAVPTLAAAAMTGGAGPMATAARFAAPAVMGGIQGMGATKGAIYEEVKQRLKADGASDAEAEARAVEQQSYGGDSSGQIALGTGLGVVAGGLGIERTMAGLRGGVAKAAPGMMTRMGTGAVTEAVPEFAQGGQEKYATNSALNNEGFQVDPMSGVVANATMEGVAGAGMGAAFGIPRPDVAQQQPAQAAPPAPTAPPPGPMQRAAAAGMPSNFTATPAATLGAQTPVNAGTGFNAGNLPNGMGAPAQVVDQMELDALVESERRDQQVMLAQMDMERQKQAEIDAAFEAEPAMDARPDAVVGPGFGAADVMRKEPEQVSAQNQPVAQAEQAQGAADGVAETGDQKAYADAAQKFNALVPTLKEARAAGKQEEVERLRDEMRGYDIVMRKAQANVQNAAIKDQQDKWRAKEVTRFSNHPVGHRVRPSEFSDGNIYWSKQEDGTWAGSGAMLQGKTATDAQLAERGGLVDMPPSPQPAQPVTGEVAQPTKAATDALPPALSSKLQEAHKALGRDVTRKQVQSMRDRVAGEIESGKANNGGVMVSLKPAAIAQRKEQLTRLDADLALFDAPAEPARPAAVSQVTEPSGATNIDYAADFAIRPVEIIEALMGSGAIKALYKSAGVKTATAFGDLPMESQSNAYAKFVSDGGAPAPAATESYNDKVTRMEREIVVRRLQSDQYVNQANGKPFKTEASAKQFSAEFDLDDTHKVATSGTGYTLRRLGEGQRPSFLKAIAERQANDPEEIRQNAAWAKAEAIGSPADAAVLAYGNGETSIDEFEAALSELSDATAEPPVSKTEATAKAEQPAQPASKFAAHDAIAREYGYTVGSDGGIALATGKESGLKVVLKGKRFQVRSKTTDDIVYSGATVDSMGKFLESFWGAEKTAKAQPAAQEKYEPWKMTREEAADAFPGDEYDKMLNRAADLGGITYAEASKRSRVRVIGGKEFWAKTRKDLEQEKKDAIKFARGDRAEVNKLKSTKGFAQWRINSMSATGKAAIEAAGKYHDGLLSIHKERVQEALDEGKDVPAEVLADYPDLKKPAAPAPQAEAKPEHRYFAYDKVAKEYGFEVTDTGMIGKNGTYPGPQVVVKAGRLRIESGGGNLLASYAATPEKLGTFLEGFWGAEKKPKSVVAESTPATENDRNSFTLQRLNQDTQAVEPITFTRGEYVQYSVGNKRLFGDIDGVSHAKQEFSVDGLWYPFGFAYKAERPEPVKPATVPLSKVIDSVNKKNGDGLTDADAVPIGQQSASQPKSKTPTVDTHARVLDAVRKGTATVGQYQASFKAMTANPDTVKAELSTRTKDDLLKAGGYYFQSRYKNDTKAEIVDAMYQAMVQEYALGKEYGSRGYMMGEHKAYAVAQAKALADLVAGQTDETLADYAAEQAKASEEVAAQRAAATAALADPKTLSDYQNVLRNHMKHGKTFKEARLMLTPEQRAKYDELDAETTREKREAKKREVKTEVRAAGQTVGGEIVATKHTRDGYDLFVVKLAERVSKEDYSTILSAAKKLGGWYSAFRGNGAIPGFQFKDKANAEAFLKLAAGDTTDAQAQAEQRRDAFSDDRSQTGAERLIEMADRLDAQADESLGYERKANTARRARFAASAEAAANADKAMAKTMRNIAGAIKANTAKFLDAVRQKTQVDMLNNIVHTAQYQELMSKYPSYAEQEKHKGEKPTAETADFADFPSYTAFRSDLASLARQLLEVDGTKKLGQSLMKVADDTSDAYTAFVKENMIQVASFSSKDGGRAAFSTRDAAEAAIARSGYKGKAVAHQVKRGEYAVVLSPSEAIARGIWKGDGDKRITLSREYGAELVQAIGRRANKTNRLSVPWQFESAHDKLKALSRMGIETPAEFRSALREFIALREQSAAPDKVKEMERAMVGRKNDGLDFFPTPQDTADAMIEAAGLEPGMSVLEPSAGMGHIAERIREAGAEPDVIEMATDRQELLEAKGFRVIGRDFTQINPREFFTFGDVFKAEDGTTGVMRGLGGMGSGRVRLVVNGDESTATYHDRDTLTGVEKRGTDSGYDRIIMNPPFSEGRDIAHVQHAYSLLRPGGRLVALMGESAFTNQNKRAEAFRTWLDDMGGTDEKLAEGTFQDPTLPVNTGANARMVVIDKPYVSDTPAASRVKFSRTNTKSGIAPTQVQPVVDTISARWANAPEIVVITDMQDAQVPEAVRKEDAAQKRNGANGEPRGFFHEGKVYLVASQLDSSRDVIETLFHEALGHAGLRGVFGPELGKILDQIATMRRADIVAKAREYGLVRNANGKPSIDVKTATNADVWAAMDQTHKRQAAEEVLATMAQDKPEIGFVKRAVAAIRAFLRKNVPGFMGMKMTDAELINSFILPARNFVERGKGSVSNEGLSFNRGTNESMTNNDVVGNQGGRSADDTTPGARAARQILEAIEQDDDGYADYGLRIVPGEFDGEINNGDILPTSKRWDNGTETDDELDGTSAARIRDVDEKSVIEALRNLGALGKNGPNGYYFGDRVLLVKGRSLNSGEDVGEVILEDAEVVGIWKKPDQGLSEIQPNESTALSRSADDSTPGARTPVEVVKQAARDAFSAYQKRTGADGDGASMEIDDNDTPVPFRAGAAAQELKNLGWEITKGDTAQYSDNDASHYISVRKKVADSQEYGPEYVTAKVRISNHGNTTKSTDQPDVNIAPGEDIVWDIEEKLNQKITDEGYELPVSAPSDARLGYAIATEQARRGKPSDGSGGNTTTNESTAPDSGGARFRSLDSTLSSAANNVRDSGGATRFSRTKIVGETNRNSWDAPEPSKFDDLVYRLQDKQIDTKRVIESIKLNGTLTDEKNVYLQEELFHGRAAARTEDFVNKELSPLVNMMKIRGLDIAALDEYLHARHAEEANKLIAERNPEIPDGGSGMTTQAARDYLAKLTPAEKTKFEAVAAKVDAILATTRQLYADYNLESQEKVDGWGEMFKHYVPLMREDKDGGMGIGQGFSIKGKEVKGRTGSTRKVVDILANIALQRERAIVRGEKNRVATALVGLVKANPNKDFWHVGPPPAQKVYDPASNSVVERADPLYKSRENVLVAKIKGKDGQVTEQAVTFNEDNERAVRMAAALKNLDAAQLEGLLGVSAKITRYFAAINTQYNPIFGTVNLVRDVQGALFNLTTTPLKGQTKAIAGDTLSALKGIYLDARAARDGKTPTSKWAQLWEEFQDEGGQTGFRDLFANSADRAKAIERELNPTAWMDSPLGKVFTADGTLKVPLTVAQKKATGVFDWLSDYNLAMENAVRLASYKAGIDQGMSKQQAASIAKNLTVNFNRKGQVGQQAGALYAFFNASMQGTARLGETLFTMEPGKPKTIRLSATGKKIVYGGVLLGVAQAVLLSAAGFEDEEPPDFVRERSMIIPTGGKTYVTIPMPLGLHVLPNMGRIPAEFAMGGFKDPAKHIAKMLGLFAGTFNPIGGGASLVQMLSPTAIDPIVALAENKDWTGKPIAKVSFNKAMPGHQLAKDTASSPAKWLSEVINYISGGTAYTAGILSPTPDQIDYLWGQATGGVGREVSKVNQTVSSVFSGEELPPHKMPLVGRFYGNADAQSSQSNQFYANINRLNEHEAEIKGRRKDGDAEGAAQYLRDNPDARLFIAGNRAEREVQKLRLLKRELVAKGADKAQVAAVEERIRARVARFNELVKAHTSKQAA